MTTLIAVAAGVVALLTLFLWWKARYTREVRRDAVRRSLAVVTGKVSEQLVPYWPQFPFAPRDARFLGAPVDFIVFDGLSEGAVRRVVFVEVKTGEARVTSRERGIRDAVDRGAVEWMELRV
ncbi:MAG TPA: Holliday junction resolvase-like protein [Gemmatimonadales bacterium]|nr:Holliday junction resolvase-like protein [Gemmatimonadales bacterium]